MTPFLVRTRSSNWRKIEIHTDTLPGCLAEDDDDDQRRAKKTIQSKSLDFIGLQLTVFFSSARTCRFPDCSRSKVDRGGLGPKIPRTNNIQSVQA